MLTDFLVALGLFTGLLVCLEGWCLFGRLARARRTEHPDQLANIQGAMLGLLALLLGFSFASVAGRYSDRAQLIVDEANAIGTAWLRCDLLAEAPRRDVREHLRRYTGQRIGLWTIPARDSFAPVNSPCSICKPALNSLSGQTL